MMRFAWPIMLAAIPTHSCAWAAKVSSKSRPICKSSSVAGAAGRLRKTGILIMGLITENTFRNEVTGYFA